MAATVECGEGGGWWQFATTMVGGGGGLQWRWWKDGGAYSSKWQLFIYSNNFYKFI